MFELSPHDPEHYRQQTRRSSFVVIAVFLAIAMLCATLMVQLFGESGGDNFRWNLAGVLVGVAITVVVVRRVLWSQPFMAAAVYGWSLKRNLMRVTNVMHHVKAGVAAGDETAMKVLRFYHQGVRQMHQLDANSSEISQMLAEVNAHLELMQARGLEVDQPRLDLAWLEAVKAYKV